MQSQIEKTAIIKMGMGELVKLDSEIRLVCQRLTPEDKEKVPVFVRLVDQIDILMSGVETGGG